MEYLPAIGTTTINKHIIDSDAQRERFLGIDEGIQINTFSDGLNVLLRKEGDVLWEVRHVTFRFLIEEKRILRTLNALDNLAAE
jgi:hypothetical protein